MASVGVRAPWRGSSSVQGRGIKLRAFHPLPHSVSYLYGPSTVYRLVVSMTAAHFSSNHSSWPDGRFPSFLLLCYLLISVIAITLATFYRTSHNLTLKNLKQSLYRTSHNLTAHNLTPHCTPHTISLYTSQTSLYTTSHNLTVHNLTQPHCTQPRTISLYTTSHNLTLHNLTQSDSTQPHTISLYTTSYNLTVHNLAQSHCTEPHTISLTNILPKEDYHC